MIERYTGRNRKARSNGNPRRSVNETEVAPEGLAQARRWTQPLPAQSPTIPTLRANPYPEVTDLFCRLPLPTLFYRPEAVHLGDLLRIWVRAGASPRVISLGFSRSHRALVDAARTAALFANTKTHSPCERIPGPRRLMQKRQLFPELRWASPSRVALPRRIRGSERFRYQVLEYGPDSLSAAFWQ